MKTQQHWIPYINYRGKKWHKIERVFNDYDTAVRCIKHMQEAHQSTTRIALVLVTTMRSTPVIVFGTKTVASQPRYNICKTCNKRRFRKNINQTTGVCLTCEMRAEVVS
jgi:hypothetical protein